MDKKTKNYAQLYLRFALGTALLSAVADRLGFWSPSFTVWGNMENFIEYTAKITSFLPNGMTTFNAYTATIAETVLGVLIIIGFKTKWVATLTGFLIMSFAISMTISLGIKSTFDASVWVGSAGAFLLAIQKEFIFSVDSVIKRHKKSVK